MAQRRIFRSLRTMTDHRCLGIGLAHAEEPRPTPLRPGDRPSDAGEAAMGASVPNEPVVDDGHVMCGPLPFAHENGSGPQERRCRCRCRAGRIVVECTVEKPIQFSDEPLRDPTLTPFLPFIGDAERENIAPDRWGRLLAQLLRPER